MTLKRFQQLRLEGKLKSLLKAITWRATATTVSILIILAITGSFEISVGFGVFDVILKIALYYLHERAWEGFI